MKGWSDVVELLLKFEADPNICDMVSVCGKLLHLCIKVLLNKSRNVWEYDSIAYIGIACIVY